MDRQQLLKRLEKAWTALKESYADLPDSQLIEPGVMGEFLDASGPLVKSFNTWDRGTLIDKFNAKFDYQLTGKINGFLRLGQLKANIFDTPPIPPPSGDRVTSPERLEAAPTRSSAVSDIACTSRGRP